MTTDINNLTPENVVVEYKPLVLCLVGKYKNRGLPTEDLIQEGMLGLLEACTRYNTKHDVLFSTYATYWIKKYILAALSTESGHTFNASSGNLENLPDYKITPELPSYQTPDNDNRIIFPTDLPVIERQILALSYKKNKTLKEIALELHLSTEKVKQIRTKALRRLKTKNPQGV